MTADQNPVERVAAVLRDQERQRRALNVDADWWWVQVAAAVLNEVEASTRDGVP